MNAVFGQIEPTGIVRVYKVACSRPGARSFPPRRDLVAWVPRNRESNVRNDDCLDGDGGQ